MIPCGAVHIFNILIILFCDLEEKENKLKNK